MLRHLSILTGTRLILTNQKREIKYRMILSLVSRCQSTVLNKDGGLLQLTTILCAHKLLFLAKTLEQRVLKTTNACVSVSLSGADLGSLRIMVKLQPPSFSVQWTVILCFYCASSVYQKSIPLDVSPSP